MSRDIIRQEKHREQTEELATSSGSLKVQHCDRFDSGWKQLG